MRACVGAHTITGDVSVSEAGDGLSEDTGHKTADTGIRTAGGTWASQSQTGGVRA